MVVFIEPHSGIGAAGGGMVDLLGCNADLALVRWRETGRHHFHAPWMLEQVDEQRRFEADLREAQVGN